MHKTQKKLSALSALSLTLMAGTSSSMNIPVHLTPASITEYMRQDLPKGIFNILIEGQICLKKNQPSLNQKTADNHPILLEIFFKHPDKAIQANHPYLPLTQKMLLGTIAPIISEKIVEQANLRVEKITDCFRRKEQFAINHQLNTLPLNDFFDLYISSDQLPPLEIKQEDTPQSLHNLLMHFNRETIKMCAVFETIFDNYMEGLQKTTASMIFQIDLQHLRANSLFTFNNFYNIPRCAMNLQFNQAELLNSMINTPSITPKKQQINLRR